MFFALKETVVLGKVRQCTNQSFRRRSQIHLGVPRRLHRGERVGTFKGSQSREEQSRREGETNYKAAGGASGNSRGLVAGVRPGRWADREVRITYARLRNNSFGGSWVLLVRFSIGN